MTALVYDSDIPNPFEDEGKYIKLNYQDMGSINMKFFLFTVVTGRGEPLGHTATLEDDEPWAHQHCVLCTQLYIQHNYHQHYTTKHR